MKQFGDRRIRFGQAIEDPMAKPAQQPALDHEACDPRLCTPFAGYGLLTIICEIAARLVTKRIASPEQKQVITSRCISCRPSTATLALDRRRSAYLRSSGCGYRIRPPRIVQRDNRSACRHTIVVRGRVRSDCRLGSR
jgi:hypothetical protein